MHDEIVHLYVDDGSLEEPNVDNEESIGEDNSSQAPLLADPQPLPRSEPTLSRFLKLLVERMSIQGRK